MLKRSVAVKGPSHAPGIPAAGLSAITQRAGRYVGNAGSTAIQAVSAGQSDTNPREGVLFRPSHLWRHPAPSEQDGLPGFSAVSLNQISRAANNNSSVVFVGQFKPLISGVSKRQINLFGRGYVARFLGAGRSVRFCHAPEHKPRIRSSRSTRGAAGLPSQDFNYSSVKSFNQKESRAAVRFTIDDLRKSVTGS